MPAKTMQLQDRDLLLLTELAEVVVMDTETVHRRFFPEDRSNRACRRRLRLLAAHGLTRAIPMTVYYANQRGGKLPTIHCLAERGAELLSERTGAKPHRILRCDPRPETLQHRLGVARLQLTVNDACAISGLPRPQWILEQDTQPGVPSTSPLSKRFILYETFPAADGKQISCRPDASSLVNIPKQSSQAPTWEALIGYWEYDRSTELLRQVARKVPGYHELITKESFKKHWPDKAQPTIRVFFVAQSEQRLQNVAATIRDQPGAAYFRLTTTTELTPANFFTSPIWRTVQGDRRAILRNSPVSNE